MNSHISRRDFLKLAAAFSFGLTAPKITRFPVPINASTHQKNILIVVFDAWSASNISLYGYARETTPNLARLAEKAVVYHQHYAGGHFTTPGTSSLLTGTLPWTHRSFALYQQLADEFLQKNIFQSFPQYDRFAYTHNPLADYILQGLSPVIDELIARRSLYLASNPLLNTLLEKDFDTASVGWNRIFNREEDGSSYSLFLSILNQKYTQLKFAKIAPNYPRGIPNRDDTDFYLLEEGVDWLTEQTQLMEQPFLGYCHLLPPHNPYKTREDFYETFADDGFQPVIKPHHPFGSVSENQLAIRRMYYDEAILYVDSEFARLYQNLEQNGMLENTWLVLTSDHGELFERGIKGHSVPVMYQPLMHIPLMIFPPGGGTRVDITEPTSAVDLLPTLLKVTGGDVPAWAEGRVLPHFAEYQTQDESRDITSVQVEKVEAGKIIAATCMCVRDNYKAIWLFGFPEVQGGGESIELFDLDSDPEELHDLSAEKKDLAEELVGMLRLKMGELAETYT
jgi:arylsulfatase A-like enzyme